MFKICWEIGENKNFEVMKIIINEIFFYYFWYVNVWYLVGDYVLEGLESMVSVEEVYYRWCSMRV